MRDKSFVVNVTVEVQDRMLAACLNLLARCSEGVPAREPDVMFSSSSTDQERFNEGRSPYDSRIAIRVCHPDELESCIASA